MYIHRFLFAVFCLVIASNVLANALDTNKQLADYLQIYPEANSTQYTEKAYKIFKQLRNFAALPRNTDSDLLIVTSVQPLAEAAVDGVVLSDTTLNLLYQKVSEEVGDTRLAFILGHEITHIEQRHVQQQNMSMAGEQRADEKGFVYAAMAGYPVHHLLTSEPDFFTYWQHATQHALDGGHPLPAQRLAALKAHLNRLLEKFNFFKAGVGLAHFNRCDDGVLFLKAFLKVYEAPEVLNSLAYCELQQAAQALKKTHYCVPFLLDAMNQTPFFSDLAEPVRSPEQRRLDRAIRYLEAVIAGKKDYFPAYLNLAAAYLYLGEINEARRQLERAVELATAQNAALLPELLVFQAVVIYEAGVTSTARIDTWNNAMQVIEDYATPDASACVLYNAAMLLERRKRSEAIKYWQLLADKHHALPEYLRQSVCDKVECAKATTGKTTQQWQLPFQWDAFLYKRNNGLTDWKSYKFKLENKTRGRIYQHFAKHQMLLTLEGYAELFIDKQPNISLDGLAGYCATPLQEKALVNGKLRACQDWAALVEGDTVKEIWVVKKR